MSVIFDSGLLLCSKIPDEGEFRLDDILNKQAMNINLTFNSLTDHISNNLEVDIILLQQPGLSQ